MSNAAFKAALALLARREYGAAELREKLIHKGHSTADAHTAVLACQNAALQSDLRFVEMLLRARIRQGYGPERIRREIQQKNLESDLFEQALATEAVDWTECAQQVLAKKYKTGCEQSWQMEQKQKQFLMYRGFSMHTIAQVFAQLKEEL